MSVENLLNSLPEHYTTVDRELIQRAYLFAEAAHEGQKRASGEPYITHCVAVAAILAELEVPPAIIAAAVATIRKPRRIAVSLIQEWK